MILFIIENMINIFCRQPYSWLRKACKETCSPLQQCCALGTLWETREQDDPVGLKTVGYWDHGAAWTDLAPSWTKAVPELWLMLWHRKPYQQYEKSLVLEATVWSKARPGEMDVCGILNPDCGICWHAPTWASVYLLAKNMMCGGKKRTGRSYSTVHSG